MRFADKGLHEITAMTRRERPQSFCHTLSDGSRLEALSERLLHEIAQRLHFLHQVGLGYLTLDRPAPTLSGGEAQRARLATHLGGGLLGVCYILDEPTMGLHPRDTQRLLDALRDLQKRGNTVIVVEHDETVIRAGRLARRHRPRRRQSRRPPARGGPVEEVLANPAFRDGTDVCHEPEALAKSSVKNSRLRFRL